jgi:GT2 family glycosyltransferase
LQVSFVIPLFNCLPLTQAMLASLQATLPPGLAHEIILVDDGSTDGTREWLATLSDPPFRIFLNEQNRGYAVANNRGAAAARGEFLALLNNDLVLTPHWLEPMLAVFAHEPAAGLVGNVQYDFRTRSLDHTGVFINHKGKPQHDKTPPSDFRPPRRDWRPVDAVTGACVLIRRTLWQQLGGFDQSYLNGCEDVDLCIRARTAGHINAVALRSAVFHHISASSGRKLRDEENCYRLTLRWRDELAELGQRAWCLKFINCDLNAATLPSVAMSVLAYTMGWRHHAPAAALAGMRAAINHELARWGKMFPLLMTADATHRPIAHLPRMAGTG